MMVWRAIELVAENLAMSWENIVLLIFLVGGLIFYASDVRIGLMLHFFTNGGLFAWFYYGGYIYQYALATSLIFLILLSFSLYAVSEADARGGFV